MNNVYMVQASATYGGNLFKSAYLPYATGLLVAYAFKNETVNKNYRFKRFVFTREITDEALESFESPAVIGFSNYIWNTRYNLTLAEKVKIKYPNCIIIFGGHNVPPDGSFLEKYPFIDFLIHSEGEEAFLSLLLENLADIKDYASINNISYRNNGEIFTTKTVVLERNDYPSPYLEGVFDNIFRENPNLQLDAILETSRGCPRHCAYCDWGCTASKVKLFPLERVLAEIDWFAEHKVAFLWGADANFGAYERDEVITKHLIEVREKTGYPERLRTNYAKNNQERVFRISRMLEKDGMSKEGATLSFQSLNPKTLKAIGRTNMSMETFRQQMILYRNAGVTTYSELILGLPLETYESFCHGIGMLLENGQHRLINVYNCEILPNSIMAQKDYREKYGIKTADVVYLTAHSKHESEITERTNYVIATDSMSTEQWVNSNIFACYEKSFHHYGILRSIAIYCYYEKNISYEDFYNSVIDFAKKSEHDVAHGAWKFLNTFYYSIAGEKQPHLYSNDIYGEISWPPGSVASLDILYRLDEFYQSISNLFLNMGIRSQILNELFEYQKCVLKRPLCNHFHVDFLYDWHTYFCNALEGNHVPLEQKHNRIFVDNDKAIQSWEDYAVNAAWFGKDGNMFNLGIRQKYLD